MLPLWALTGTGLLRAHSTGNIFPLLNLLPIVIQGQAVVILLRNARPLLRQSACFPTPWPDMALHHTYITWLHGSHGSYVSSNRLAALYCGQTWFMCPWLSAFTPRARLAGNR